MNAYLDAMKKYFVSSGRSGISELMQFYGIHIVIIGLLLFVNYFAGCERVFSSEQTQALEPMMPGWLASIHYDYLIALYIVVVLVPSIMICIRRMHDVGRSGWWLAAPLVNFVFLAMPGNKDENTFGPPVCKTKQEKK